MLYIYLYIRIYIYIYIICTYIYIQYIYICILGGDEHPKTTLLFWCTPEGFFGFCPRLSSSQGKAERAWHQSGGLGHGLSNNWVNLG